ncbi:MAG TPA: hypothetical protein VK907_04675 [Phnomibacter sp.]|nr:hypothetical protein [Phnomibacter sp.]
MKDQFLTLVLFLAFSYGSTAQNVGIGTNSPTSTLDVNGTIRIRGGSPGAGKVLTSDANGNASWKSDNFVAFRAAGLLDNVPLTLIQAGWKKVHYSLNPQYNIGIGYSGLSGNFVAPFKGIYHFDVRADLMDQQWEVHMRLVQKRGNTQWDAAYIRNTAMSTSDHGVKQLHNMVISTDLMVEAGDTFWVEVYSWGSSNVRISPATRANWFGAHMVKAM